MPFQVLLSLWSVTSYLCIDKIPKVAKTKFSKPKRYSLSKLRLLRPPKTAHLKMPPHFYVTMWGDLQNSMYTPKCIRKERRQNYYSRCSIVAAAGAVSWRWCVFIVKAKVLCLCFQKRTQLQISG